MILKNKNIIISLDDDNDITIEINNESDLIFVFSLVKTMTHATKFIPSFIYQIFIDNSGNKVKIKRNLSLIKKLSIWDFIDMKTDDSIVYSSGEAENKIVNGWEIVFRIKISDNDLLYLYEESLRFYEGLIKKIKKMDENI